MPVMVGVSRREKWDSKIGWREEEMLAELQEQLLIAGKRLKRKILP